MPQKGSRPLYPPAPWLYWDVEAAIALVTFNAESVEPLLPEGVEVLGDQVMGAVWIARYPRSTLGPYNEALIAIQVYVGGEPRFFIPYIYVDSDVALAAGREVAGAPKKYADIGLEWSGRSVVGWARRAGMVIRVEVSPEYVASGEVLEALLSRDGTLLLNVRELPGVPGGGSVRDLVAWRARVWFHRSMGGGALKAWAGPSRVELVGGVEDPVGELEVVDVVEGFYAFFDMELSVDKVLWRRVEG